MVGKAVTMLQSDGEMMCSSVLDKGESHCRYIRHGIFKKEMPGYPTNMTDRGLPYTELGSSAVLLWAKLGMDHSVTWISDEQMVESLTLI